jgi:hypothetical protein
MLAAIGMEWKNWWSGLGAARRLAPLAAFGGYALLLVALGGFRADHAAILGALALLAYAGPRLAPVLDFALPFGLVALAYDSLRFYKHLVRGAVNVAEPYLLERSLFGVPGPDGSILTLNEFWQLHQHSILDLYAGFFYISFLALFALTAAYWRFVHPGSRKRPEARGPAWAFLWTNLAGYATYLIYPAAPPWYVALYGLGPARLDAAPSAAGGLRFDSLLGVDVFASFYSKSQDIFGAIPSLHVAYPMIAVFFAYRLGVGRAWTTVFYLSIFFGAIYLNHHYVIDLILGSLYALLVSWVVLTFLRSASAPREAA